MGRSAPAASRERGLGRVMTGGCRPGAMGGGTEGFPSEAGNYCLATESSDECGEGSEASSKGSRVGSGFGRGVCLRAWRGERRGAPFRAPGAVARGLGRARRDSLPADCPGNLPRSVTRPQNCQRGDIYRPQGTIPTEMSNLKNLILVVEQ
ncbi:unnamed protein product [Rangifer tarandus platyrhynchus]|uniref:Uncharacterized protein n=2 Tax=Rangifer tarandus platyrhynchus TaxID=3082113 RepID=A0ACB0ESH7_RANTA|nr:unnamed protein product [Rangifer tarandus platyrhynchus]CAI9703727.1 unnamed protein product [Rangifer tarandus platyrhynchus]